MKSDHMPETNEKHMVANSEHCCKEQAKNKKKMGTKRLGNQGKCHAIRESARH